VLEMEAEAGAKTEVPSRGIAESTQAGLPSDSALFSFHLGEPQSFLWALSRNRFRLYKLPLKTELAGDITEFAEGVKHA
jgi:hypothetical protein